MGRTKLKGMSPFGFRDWGMETNSQTSHLHLLIHLMFTLEIGSLGGSCPR
jgi:hypothetical protein